MAIIHIDKSLDVFRITLLGLLRLGIYYDEAEDNTDITLTVSIGIYRLETFLSLTTHARRFNA